MSSDKEPLQTVIEYETVRHSGYVLWSLKYEDGSNIHLFVAQENGSASNKSKAKKAAEHAKRLTDAALAKR
ncbi:hypothetical protein [Paenarthrobacter sp. C1]|uniref:hypothetical protein n=1 Tax=Paenarthrobacter sp. C1 TaxID=3400220 RepID=UPI003BF5625A